MTSVQPYPTDQLDELTPKQLADMLAVIVAEPNIGTVHAARKAGVAGSRRQIRSLLASYSEEIREARGWNIVQVENTIWDVAKNPEHPSWERAAGRLVKAYGGEQFLENATLEVTAGVTVERREVSLQGVLHILADAGALDTRLVDALAASRPVLPAHTD